MGGVVVGGEDDAEEIAGGVAGFVEKFCARFFLSLLRFGGLVGFAVPVFEDGNHPPVFKLKPRNIPRIGKGVF